MYDFTGYGGTPGIRAIRETVEADLLFGDIEFNKAFMRPAVIDGASVDQGSSPTNLLRPGLLMALDRSTGKLLPWDPTDAGANPDIDQIWGPLVRSINVHELETDQDRWLPNVMAGGMVKSDKLIVDGASSTAGISGHAMEWEVRRQMAGRFWLDDGDSTTPRTFHQSAQHGAGQFHRVVAKTANYTVTPYDNNTLFTNLGDADAINFTLPADANSRGLHFGFYAAADFSLTVTAATADTLIVFNDAAADSVAYATAGDILGGMFEVFGHDNSTWLVIPHNWADGVLVQTITIVTA